MNAFDRDFPLSTACDICQARPYQRCLPECDKPPTDGPNFITITPGDQYDTNPEHHPPVKQDPRWSRAI